MKCFSKLISGLAFLTLSLGAHAMDLNGTWKGSCTRNAGEPKNVEWEIQLIGREKLMLAGQEFTLGKKVVTEENGTDPQGKKFWEKVTLNWHFNPEGTEIVTNKEMEGHYLDGSGRWTTSGTGVIRRQGERLEISRTFVETFNGEASKTHEVCLLKRM